MNIIFLLGEVKDQNVLFTPKGEKIHVIPVSLDEVPSVEVFYLDSERRIGDRDLKGKMVMVIGSLMKFEPREGIRIRAKKIEVLEE